MQARANQHGYTLLEVLVAFAILGMALTVLFRIFSAGLNNVGAASEYVRAVEIGQARLAAPGDGGVLAPGVSRGTELDKYRWTRTISRAELPELAAAEGPAVAAFQVSVAVEWPAGSNTRQIEMGTIRLAELPERTGARR